MRDAAIVVLLVFGIVAAGAVAGRPGRGAPSAACCPRAQAPRRATTASLGARCSGASLGLVYAPCAGPILAGVITVSASQDFTAGAAGAWRSPTRRQRGGALRADARWPAPARAPRARSAGASSRRIGRGDGRGGRAMLADLDIRFQTAIADDLPAVLVNPSKELEETGAGARAAGRSAARSASPDRGRAARDRGLAPAGAGRRARLHRHAAVVQHAGRAAAHRSASLRGRVVLVDFWTYTCINCIRTLPYLKAWDARYRDDRPHDRGRAHAGVPVRARRRQRGRGHRAQIGLRYAVAQDNDYATWNAYGNQYWPAKYLIDARGRVRYVHFGEGAYDETETAIRRLLAEAGRAPGAERARPRERSVAAPSSDAGDATSAQRAQSRFVDGPTPARHAHDFALPDAGLPRGPRSPTGRVAHRGPRGDRAPRRAARGWHSAHGASSSCSAPAATSRDGAGACSTGSRSPTAGRRRTCATASRRGRAASASTAWWTCRVRAAQLTLDFAPGVSGYAFTFG